MCFGEKVSNLMSNWRKKPDRSINEKLSNSNGTLKKKIDDYLSKSQIIKIKDINKKSSHLVGN